MQNTMTALEAATGTQTASREDILTLAQQIANKFNPHKIVLFGSHARGAQHRFSDIDLLVILDKNQEDVDLEVEVALSVQHKFPMDILVRSPREVTRRLQLGDPFFRDILEQGVVLYERSSA
jgi:predicted nucleotidyltransferase